MSYYLQYAVGPMHIIRLPRASSEIAALNRSCGGVHAPVKSAIANGELQPIGSGDSVTGLMLEAGYMQWVGWSALRHECGTDSLCLVGYLWEAAYSTPLCNVTALITGGEAACVETWSGAMGERPLG